MAIFEKRRIQTKWDDLFRIVNMNVRVMNQKMNSIKKQLLI